MITLNNKIPVSITMGGKNVETIKMGNEIVWGRVQEMFYIENTHAGSNVVTLTTTYAGTVDSSKYASSIQYSKDGLNWTNQTLSSTATISLSQGERVYFRGSNGVFNYYESDSVNNITKFSAQYSHKVGGNINSLLNYNNMYNVPLTQGCFESLFNGDTTLTSASDLYMPSTTLVAFCYDQLFMGCTSLTNYPQQPVQTMASNCMRSMYRGCSSLVNPPSLPSTELYPHCYNKLFMGCTSLTSAPVLPATTMKASCYRQMFSGCTALTTAPELPATSLSDSCYRQMFENTGLTTSPKLPAKTISQNAYYQMFQGCSNLNKVYVYADDNSATDCTYNWLSSVAATGTFVNYGTATYTLNSVSGIPTGWTEVKATEISDYFYCKNEADSTSAIQVVFNGTPNSSRTATSMEYSDNGVDWTRIVFQADSVTHIPCEPNQKIYFRNNNGFLNYASNIKFYSNKNYSVGGELASLYNWTGEHLTAPNGCFQELFSEGTLTVYNDYLVDASNLKLVSKLPTNTANNVTYTYLPYRFYYRMFYHCRNLVGSPSMLYGQLAGEDSCKEMFAKCQSMTSAPTILTEEVGYGAFQWMFSNCSSLLTVPTMSFTTVGDYACYAMFSACSSMTGNAILLPTVTKNWSYENMFSNCSKLQEVTLYAQYCDNLYDANKDEYEGVHNMLQGTANTGTLHNLGGFQHTGYANAPQGWTITTT